MGVRQAALWRERGRLAAWPFVCLVSSCCEGAAPWALGYARDAALSLVSRRMCGGVRLRGSGWAGTGGEARAPSDLHHTSRGKALARRVSSEQRQ